MTLIWRHAELILTDIIYRLEYRIEDDTLTLNPDPDSSDLNAVLVFEISISGGYNFEKANN